MNKTFSLRLTLAREARCLTQRQLAVLSGLQESMISRYECGRLPDLPNLVKLCRALGVTADYLIGDHQ